MWDRVSSLIGTAAPVLGTALGGPAGGTVGGLISAALGTRAEPEAVEQALSADPEALAKLRTLEQEHAHDLRRLTLEAETERLAQINRTMRAEAAASDAYVRRWRPTFGYLVAVTWAAQTGGLVWAMVAHPVYAADLIQAITALTPMWGIALAVLGINVHKRSQDKQTAAGRPVPGLGDLIGKLKPKSEG